MGPNGKDLPNNLFNIDISLIEVKVDFTSKAIIDSIDETNKNQREILSRSEINEEILNWSFDV